MVAYKIWDDQKHYIHKDTTSELNVRWTTDKAEAKEVTNFAEAWGFFVDTLGFSFNTPYDKLKLEE